MKLEDLIAAKGREFWVENRSEVNPSNRMLYAYDEQQHDLHIYHCEDHRKCRENEIHVTEAAHAERLREALKVAVDALLFKKQVSQIESVDVAALALTQITSILSAGEKE